MLYVVNIMINYGFDFKAVFAKKGMPIAPFQDKNIIVFALLISGCEVVPALLSRIPDCSIE